MLLMRPNFFSVNKFKQQIWTTKNIYKRFLQCGLIFKDLLQFLLIILNKFKLNIRSEYSPLKGLPNCILCVSRVKSLFCSIRAYLDLVVYSTYSFGKLVLVAFLCFLSFLLVLRFEINAIICIIIIYINATVLWIFLTLLFAKT